MLFKAAGILIVLLAVVIVIGVLLIKIANKKAPNEVQENPYRRVYSENNEVEQERTPESTITEDKLKEQTPIQTQGKRDIGPAPKDFDFGDKDKH